MIRSLARGVSKNVMKRVGIHRSCSKRGIRGNGSKKTMHNPKGGEKSYFAEHWREFV